MNIPKAIEILEQNSNTQHVLTDPPFHNSIKLSIEALEFFQKFQKVTGGHQDARLPSETEA